MAGKRLVIGAAGIHWPENKCHGKSASVHVHYDEKSVFFVS
jgi:hypothetical protein